MPTRQCVSVIVMVILLSSSVLWAQESATDSEVLKKNSFGLGLGIPYGILGLNLDVNVVPNLNLSAGVGHTILAGIGYNVGFKCFFTSIEKTFRPRVSAYYGINTLLETTNIDFGEVRTKKETYTGISLGIGMQLMFGKTRSNGFDFDIIYIATSGLDIDKLRDEGFVVESSPVKISFGYRHGF